MSIKTIQYIKGKVRIIDQTKLPNKLSYIDCRDVKTLWRAIKKLEIRGAPAIGIAAGFGVVLAIKHSKAKTSRQFMFEVEKAARYLATSRPTAVNLFWALERMRRVTRQNLDKSVASLKRCLVRKAMQILEEDRRICRAMAKFGSKLINKADRILTICNAGALATADYGTALGVMYEAKKQNKRIKVYVCETRPLLQGARLTTWELKKEKIDVTLICDSMAADLMRKRCIDKVFVGADRIAANGDAANKIGTYNLAVLAKFHNIPFYVVAPVSTFDFSLKKGSKIPIEQREIKEVTQIQGKAIAPAKVKVYNPAFDVTPQRLIGAIITEKGIFKSPNSKSLSLLKGIHNSIVSE